MFANRTVVSGVGDLLANDWLARTFFYGTVGNGFFSWLAQIGWMPALPNGDALIKGLPNPSSTVSKMPQLIISDLRAL